MIKNNVKNIYIILMLLCILVGCVQLTEVSSKKQVEPSKQVIEVDSPIGGIAQINQNGKIGYRLEDGTVLVEPIYDNPDPSPEEHENYRLLGKSQEDGTVLWGHVTGTGIVVEPQFDKPYTFFENVIVPNSEIFQLAFVYQNGEGGIIKQNGEWFIEIGIYLFKEQVGNLAVVSEKEFPTKLGVIPGNSGYKILVPFIFDTIDIREESIEVEINDKRGSYTMDGILILDPKFKNVHYQGNGYIEFSVGEHNSAEELFGIATIGGEIVVPAEYDLIYNEVEGLTIAIKDKKYGYFDENWEIAIPFEYDFASGIALVKKEGKSFFITKENQFAFSLPENYNLYNAKFTDGIGFLMIDQRDYFKVRHYLTTTPEYSVYRYGYVNTKGEISFESEDYVVTDSANGSFYMKDFIKDGQYPIIVSNPEDYKNIDPTGTLLRLGVNEEGEMAYETQSSEDSFTAIPLKEEGLQFKYIDEEGNPIP